MSSNDVPEIAQESNESEIKRLALIFNHYEFKGGKKKPRKGTHQDEIRLREVLKDLEFLVDSYLDLTKSELMKKLIEVSNRTDLSNLDRLVVIVLSHGDDLGIWAKDRPYEPKDLWKHFTRRSSPWNKVEKMFFLQACRGNEPNEGHHHDGEDADGNVNGVPTTPNMLVAYSTTEKFVSIRQEDGSLFIKALCDVIRDRSGVEDVVSMLTRVNRTVAFGPLDIVEYTNEKNKKVAKHCKQIGQIVSTLFERTYINSSGQIDNVRYQNQSIERYERKGRGKAMIFNHSKFKNYEHVLRNDSEEDKERLKTFLEKNNFDVRVFENLTDMQVGRELNRDSEEEYDCLFVIFISYHYKGDICAYNIDVDKEGRPKGSYSSKYLADAFSKRGAKQFLGKPKIFLKITFPTEAFNRNIHDGDDEVGDNNLPTDSDVVTVNVSHEMNFENSYLNVLCQELEKGVKQREDLLNILAKVNKSLLGKQGVEKNKQTQPIVSTFVKKFYF